MNIDALSSQKDKENVRCCDLEAEVMSNTKTLEINGCKVVLRFAVERNPQVETDIATLLVSSFVRRCTA